MIYIIVAFVSWLLWLAIWTGCNIKEWFCRHDYEEQYRYPSYERKEDLKNWITNWVDVGYICKKCKKVKKSSITFRPICNRWGWEDY